MNSNAQEKLQELLKNSSDYDDDDKETFEQFKLKLRQEFTLNSTIQCSLSEFAVYYLNSIRKETEQHLKANEGETPQSQTPVRSAIKSASTTNQARKLQPSMLCFESSTPEVATGAAGDGFKNDLSLNNSSFCHGSTASTPVSRRLNSSGNQSRRCLLNYSAAAGNGGGGGASANSTPNSSSRNNSASSSLCLGDFLVLNSSGNHQNRSNKKRNSLNYSNNAADNTPSARPKKRVVPTTISSSSKLSQSLDNPFGNISSSFGNENNLSKLSSSELEDKNKCLILEARKSLKANALEISKELENSVIQSPNRKDLKMALESKITPTKEIALNSSIKWEMNADFAEDLTLDDLNKISCKSTLKRMAYIYCWLLECNFVTNILNELSFIVNLFNINLQNANCNQLLTDTLQSLSLEQTSKDALSLLKLGMNCIYFALSILRLQKQLLLHLDVKSLGVILSTQRLAVLDNNLNAYFMGIYQQKQQLYAVKSTTLPGYATPSKTRRLSDSKSFGNVYYHEEQESRQHFPSNTEFCAFKTQRDLFYRSLKQWELNHLKPSWSFSLEITPKIRELFRQSENAINMTHFAKLFVAQLLISSSDTQTPQDIGLEIDVQKFHRLAQRLIAPSNFSVDYQFPRSQAFFRDFINECQSWAFCEHLKLALYAELLNLNDCTMDQMTLYDNAEQEQQEEQNDLLLHSSNQEEMQNVVVRPEVLASMLILAKFLGFVTALPYDKCCSSSEQPQYGTQKEQLALRSLFQPNFKTTQLLINSLKHGKILITLPWLVQYLIMLDNITLQMQEYQECLQQMFELYAACNDFYWKIFEKLPLTAQFIVRCCLGWLFENKPFIAEQYYVFRQKYEKLPQISQQIKDNIIPFNLNPLLETTLNVACPFLAEFRVSIMPAKQAQVKYLSRTGRYRHITTRLTELPNATTSSCFETVQQDNKTEDCSVSVEQKQQSKLIDAFLHSQNASTRRLIPFVTERIYKCVIKDAQLKILIPSKTAADAEVNKINCTNYDEIQQNVIKIYTEAQKTATNEWNKQIPQMLTQRTNSALNSLLPQETQNVIKQTYAMLIRQNAAHKISQWFQGNVLDSSFYCSNLTDMCTKICKANQRKSTAAASSMPSSISSSELILKAESPSVSDILDNLQYWLHATSKRGDLLQHQNVVNDLCKYLQIIPKSFDYNTLPSIYYRLIGSGVLQIMQHSIFKHHQFINKIVFNHLKPIWNAKQMLPYTKMNTAKKSSSESLDIPCIFDGLITSAFIKLLSQSKNSFEKLQQFLIFLIQEHILTIDYLNNQFVYIFKEDWPTETLAEISQLLKQVAKETANVRNSSYSANSDSDSDDENKSNLFMELLADISRDSDFI